MNHVVDLPKAIAIVVDGDKRTVNTKQFVKRFTLMAQGFGFSSVTQDHVTAAILHLLNGNKASDVLQMFVENYLAKDQPCKS